MSERSTNDLECAMRQGLAQWGHLLYFSLPHERKITSKQENETKGKRVGDGRTCGTAHALWALHYLWLPGAWPPGRSGRAGSRQAERKICAAGARSLAVPDRRRADFNAMRLPRPA